MFFFFQAEDGIRDRDVTGVQTYALPIYERTQRARDDQRLERRRGFDEQRTIGAHRKTRAQLLLSDAAADRSEERRVGKEWRSRVARSPCKKSTRRAQLRNRVPLHVLSLR